MLRPWPLPFATDRLAASPGRANEDALPMKPSQRPARPFFSSGPCAKRPGWSAAALKDAVLGRSHRSKPGKARLLEVIERSKALLGMPEDFRLGILVGSDTAAVEAALWSLLGPRGVDVLAWESFGQDWVTDVVKELRLKDARALAADYGALPDLAQVDFARDVVFTWNGTTSGVRVPDAAWIPAGRAGLTICDATSAVFAMRLDWSKLDAVTWSWQKVIGGEAGQGMLALSPRAVARLESHTPAWPVPKIFRLAKKGKLDEGIFRGDTINTPSMLCVEDALDALRWVEEIGGLAACIARSEANLAAISAWVERTPWVEFLARNPATRSCTSVCLAIADPAFAKLPEDLRADVPKKLAGLLEKEGVAFDVASYRSAPPGLRLWGGATVEREDLEALFPWLDWAWEQVRPR
jgi:phosphoserine aminotransferase